MWNSTLNSRLGLNSRHVKIGIMACKMLASGPVLADKALRCGLEKAVKNGGSWAKTSFKLTWRAQRSIKGALDLSLLHQSRQSRTNIKNLQASNWIVGDVIWDSHNFCQSFEWLLLSTLSFLQGIQQDGVAWTSWSKRMHILSLRTFFHRASLWSSSLFSISPFRQCCFILHARNFACSSTTVLGFCSHSSEAFFPALLVYSIHFVHISFLRWIGQVDLVPIATFVLLIPTHPFPANVSAKNKGKKNGNNQRQRQNETNTSIARHQIWALRFCWTTMNWRVWDIDISKYTTSKSAESF